jgi:tripartite-type tricarboxylate transporter receptor subunit TctC
MRPCAIFLVGLLGSLPPAAHAEGAADYFKGKTVSYIVATAPGGGYDTYGRLVAEFMQKQLPGSTFVVRNVPGAGTVIGTNMIFAAKPDGLTIGTFNTGLIYSQIVQNEGVRFDLTKMSWIGKAASDGRAILVSTSAPVKKFEDLLSLKQPVNFSTGGTSGATYIETKMLKDSLHLQIRILTGYDGNDDQMAMRRGEIVGALGSRSSYDDFVRNGYGQFLAQIGGKSTDVRQLSTIVTEPLAKAVVALIQSQGDLARVTAGPPGIKPDILATLRTAYRAALEDKEFLSRAARLNLPIEPAYGDDVAKSVASALAQPPETVKMLNDILKAEKN